MYYYFSSNFWYFFLVKQLEIIPNSEYSAVPRKRNGPPANSKYGSRLGSQLWDNIKVLLFCSTNFFCSCFVVFVADDVIVVFVVDVCWC